MYKPGDAPRRSLPEDYATDGCNSARNKLARGQLSGPNFSCKKPRPAWSPDARLQVVCDIHPHTRTRTTAADGRTAAAHHRRLAAHGRDGARVEEPAGASAPAILLHTAEINALSFGWWRALPRVETYALEGANA